MAEISGRAAVYADNLKPENVDSVTVGNVCQVSSKNGPYISRHAALRIGVPLPVPCLTVNRLCGSGFQAVVSGTQVCKVCLKSDKSQCLVCFRIFFYETRK